MRTDDIFEAMTDIDDKFIEAARPLELMDFNREYQVVPAKKPPKRAIWKSLVPAAAFVAVVAAAGVVGVNYLRTNGVRTTTAASISESLKEYWYPDEAKFVVDDNITRFNTIYQLIGGRPLFDTITDYAENYEELAKNSDLIVSGTFIDVIHQTSDSKEIWSDADKLQMSYNWFETESVIKGDISPGSVLTIGQNSTLNSCNAEDGTCNYIMVDQLSPMLKGDKWIYFLKLEDDGTFSPVNGPQGRYPLPNCTNRLISWDGETSIVDEFYTDKNAAPARDEIYEELLKQLELVSKNTPKIEQIGVPGQSFNTFTIEEFEGVEFKVSRLGVTADDVEVFSMGDGQLDNLFIADLNGDGKRELCATITEDTRSRAVVRDFVSGSYYTLGSKREYFLSVNDNVLNVNEHMWPSPDLSIVETEPLSLAKMLWTVPNKDIRLITLNGEETFCLEEYPDIPFRVSENGVTVDETQFGYLRHVIFGGVELEKLFLADITGDGKRELVALGSCNGKSETLAHNIETGETRIISGAAGYTVYGADGMLVTLNGDLLTFDMMPKTDTMDYGKVSLEHHGSFTLPDFEDFEFRVNKQIYTSFTISYHSGRSNIGLSTSPRNAYFCDLDGDGHREIVMNYVTNTEGEIGVAVYDVMENADYGKAEYEGRVIEENGRLLLESSSGVSELKYSKADLMPVVERYSHHVNPNEDCVIGLSGVFTSEQHYNAEIFSGRLKITRDGETLFRSANEIGELGMVMDEGHNRMVFAFTNKTNGCIDALMLTETSTKLICLNDAENIGNAPVDANDILFNFNDGTMISYSSLLEHFEAQ